MISYEFKSSKFYKIDNDCDFYNNKKPICSLVIL